MTREEADALVADVMVEHFARLRADLEALIERAVAAKPIPPFVPPPVWTEGRHGAGAVVRAHGGLFLARRDTEGHPGDDDGAWLPLVVGLAGFDMRWVDDHKFVCMARLSDGRVVETEREIAVPIVRGYWSAETNYLPGDRVFRYGEHSAVKMSLGVDPTSTEADGVWEKVGGKYARALTWALDEASLMLSENGRDVGSIRPGLLSVVEEALARHLGKAAEPRSTRMDEPNGPRLVASEGQAVAKDAPPGLLDMIKDDLNIPLDDTTNDAWLQRRIDNVWARFEKYCCRALPVPPAQFIDDWSLIAEHSNRVEPWVLDHWPVGSPFLRYCPVVSIDAITSGWPGQLTDRDPAGVMFEPASGKLFGLDGVAWAHDVSGWLRWGSFRITYTAGWAECPGDLYEALLNIIAPMWQARAAQQAGGGFGGGTISRINIVDVGEVDLDTAGAFVEAASRARGGGDPMLGPWITLLDSYVDVRVQMGSPLIPVTTAVPVP